MWNQDDCFTIQPRDRRGINSQCTENVCCRHSQMLQHVATKFCTRHYNTVLYRTVLQIRWKNLFKLPKTIVIPDVDANIRLQACWSACDCEVLARKNPPWTALGFILWSFNLAVNHWFNGKSLGSMNIPFTFLLTVGIINPASHITTVQKICHSEIRSSSKMSMRVALGLTIGAAPRRVRADGCRGRVRVEWSK